MAALQRRAHHVDIADALEAEIHPAVGQFDNHILNRLIVVVRVDKVGCAHLFCQGELIRVGIDRQNPSGLRLHRALDHRETNAAQTKDRDAIPGLDLRRVVHCADTGGDTAAQQAHFIQRRLRIDFRQRDLGANRIFAEGAGAHIVINRFAVIGKTGGAVRHQPFALGGAHRLTEIGFTRLTELALAAFGGIQRDHVVARLKAGDALAHFHDNPAAFMAQYRRENTFRIVAGEGEGIGVAHAGVGDFHQNFAFLRRRDVNLNDF